MSIHAGAFAREGAQLQATVQGDHLCQDLQDFLGDGLVVYRDQVLGLRVDLEGLVEGQGCLDVVGA